MEAIACHEAGRFQVENRLDDVRDLAHMANWVQGAELCMRLARMHWSLDDAGRHRAHPDAVFCLLYRERFGRGSQTALGQRRQRGRYVGDLVIHQARRDLHDMAAALLLHLGDGELRDVKEPGDVDARIAA
jgi:hypothetical protein